MERITDRIITALDYSDFSQVESVVNKIGEYGIFYKVGLELYTSCGEKVLYFLKEKGKKIFLDLKFHDIPNTVAQAVKNVSRYDVEITNVHALGGLEMMRKSKEVLKEENAKTKLIAITILTSFDQRMLHEIGIEEEISESVRSLALLTQKAGLDGVVSSPLEANMIKEATGNSFLTITPGIRFETDSKDDQQRIMTPLKALSGASDYIVMGRSITGSNDPKGLFEKILEDSTRI